MTLSDGRDPLRIGLPETVAQTRAEQVRGDALYDAGTTAQLVRPTPDGVRIFTVLDSAAAEDAWSYDLQLPAGWTVVDSAGGFEIRDEVGAIRYVIEAPWARDARGVTVPARYALSGTVLTLSIDDAGATYPVVADPFARIRDDHVRQTMELRDATVWTRGYIASNCLIQDVACESEAGSFRGECTAQSKALRSLGRYNNLFGWIPSDRIVDDSPSPIDDEVQWEVGRYKGRDGDCGAPETGRSWRVDILVRPFSPDNDLVTLIEVKEWRGVKTTDDVDRQLGGYFDRFADLRRTGGPRAEPEERLSEAGWAWCYQNNGKMLLGSRREYCAWADVPGHVYFAPVDKISGPRLRELRERFARTQEAERNADDSLAQPDETRQECPPASGGTTGYPDCIWDK